MGKRVQSGDIPLHILTRIRALPYRIEEGRLKIAVADPSNIQLTDELRIVSAAKEHAVGVISRLKVLSKLDIAEHRMPQDGRISVRAKSSGRLFDIRIAVLPTVEGEGVIMRLLQVDDDLRGAL